MVLWEVETQQQTCVRVFPLTHLGQGQHHEGSSATGIHNHGHKFGVDRAEVAVPCHLGDSDVIVALVSFQSLAKDVTELTGSYNPPGHGELERKARVNMNFYVCMNPVATDVLLQKVIIWMHVAVVMSKRHMQYLYVCALGSNVEIKWDKADDTAERHDRGKLKKKEKRKQKLSQLLPLVCGCFSAPFSFFNLVLCVT